MSFPLRLQRLLNSYLSIAAGCVIFAAATASAQNPWVLGASGTGVPLAGVTHGAGLFVMVGDAGLIRTSENGVSWTARTSNTVRDLRGVAYGNGMFVACGAGGTIVSSPDGVTWTGRFSGLAANFISGVAYGNGMFVATGESGLVTRSADGITWTASASGVTTKFLQDVAFGGGAFVAVGESGTVVRSIDGGQTWALQAAVTFQFLTGVGSGEGHFVATGLFGTILTSPDGVTWTPRFSGTTEFLFGTAYANGMYIAVGDSGKILYSEDLANWAPDTSATTTSLSAATAGEGLLIAVGDVGRIVRATAPSVFNYAKWKKINFTVVEQGDPLVSGPGVDPEEDTRENFEEYGFGLVGKIRDGFTNGVLTPLQVIGGGGMEHGAVRFWRPNNRTLLSYGLVRLPETGETGMQPVVTVESIVAEQGDFEMVQLMDSEPITSTGAMSRRVYEVVVSGE